MYEDADMARPKSFNKEHVLEAAMKVFWKQGFDGTSMKDLELATQLTPGSIYHEFGSKEGMFEHALDFYVDKVMLGRVNQYLVECDDPIQSIHDFIISSFKDVPSDIRGDACLLVNTATELGKTRPAISVIIKRGFRLIEKSVYEQLQSAQVSGQIREELDCKAGARQLVFLMSGLLVASKNQQNASLLSSTVDFTLAGYR